MSDYFPIRRYAVEVSMWEQSTSIPPERRAALCIGQLRGFAKTEGEKLLADAVIAQQLRYGAIHNATGQAMSGVSSQYVAYSDIGVTEHMLDPNLPHTRNQSWDLRQHPSLFNVVLLEAHGRITTL